MHIYIYIYTHTHTHTRTHTYIDSGILITQPYKRNKFESVLVRWIKLEPVEVSQKEKNKYHILAHIYGI